MVQGNPLFTTILNVVVDAVVLHLKYLVVEESGGDNSDDIIGEKSSQPAIQTIRAHDNIRRRTEKGQTQLKMQAVFLYADNSMVASTNLG